MFEDVVEHVKTELLEALLRYHILSPGILNAFDRVTRKAYAGYLYFLDLWSSKI